MESKKLLPAIVALLLIASVLSISTTGVSATHTPTVKIDGKDAVTVKPNTSMVLTITVQNGAGSDPINRVEIIVPTGWGLAPTLKVPKDNLLECVDNNNVVLPKGTIVRLVGSENVRLYENTDVIRENNTWVWVPILGENALLRDNAEVEPTGNRDITGGLAANDNVVPERDTTVTLADNTLRLLSDTVVVRVNGNVVRLPENTMLQVVGDVQTGDNLVTGDNVAVENYKAVTLPDNGMRLVKSVPVLRGGAIEGSLGVGVLLQLMVNNNVTIPKGRVVGLLSNTAVTVLENENVMRVVGDRMLLVTPDAAENQPKNWTQATGTSTLPPGDNAVWAGIAENRIAGGASLDFPFAVTTPSSTAYTIYVETTDTAGATVQKTVTLTVDNVPPTVTIAASPSWVKDNVQVTITVTADNSLAKLENVMVAENNAPENTQISMTPNADNTVWTGTYTTGDNENRDGTATIYVIGAQFEDLVGNTGSDTKNTFTVDRMVPPTPDLSAITGFPTTPTNVGSWFIQGTAQDNFLRALTVQEGMTVKIRVGTTVTPITTPASGYYSKTITLTEGKQEVGIQYIDKAGNVGTENAENVIYDKTKPSFSMTSPAAGAIIKDNTPSFVLVITDAVMGVENANFDNTDNSGYIVRLCRDDNTVIAQLTPKAFPTSAQFNSFTFENDYPSELADNFYKIFVQAGDNLQSDNAYFRFEIDTKPPAAPTLSVTKSQIPDAPSIEKSTTVALGGTCEPYATVKIWTSSGPLFTDETNVGSVVDTDGDGNWTTTITIAQGVNTRIRVSAVDMAGNESTTKTLYGYLMVDATAPTVSITSPATGTKTDKASIEVKGTITKDAWETWTDITLRVQIGLTSTTVPISAGSFSVNVALTEGTNTIIASVTDAVGNASSHSVTVERTVTPWGTYAIIIVIVALILSAIAIFKKK